MEKKRYYQNLGVETLKLSLLFIALLPLLLRKPAYAMPVGVNTYSVQRVDNTERNWERLNQTSWSERAPMASATPASSGRSPRSVVGRTDAESPHRLQRRSVSDSDLTVLSRSQRNVAGMDRFRRSTRTRAQWPDFLLQLANHRNTMSTTESDRTTRNLNNLKTTQGKLSERLNKTSWSEFLKRPKPLIRDLLQYNITWSVAHEEPLEIEKGLSADSVAELHKVLLRRSNTFRETPLPLEYGGPLSIDVASGRLGQDAVEWLQGLALTAPSANAYRGALEAPDLYPPSLGDTYPDQLSTDEYKGSLLQQFGRSINFNGVKTRFPEPGRVRDKNVAKLLAKHPTRGLRECMDCLLSPTPPESSQERDVWVKAQNLMKRDNQDGFRPATWAAADGGGYVKSVYSPREENSATTTGIRQSATDQAAPIGSQQTIAQSTSVTGDNNVVSVTTEGNVLTPMESRQTSTTNNRPEGDRFQRALPPSAD